MRVLVTGNLGYIGPVLCEALALAGHEVHGYDSALFARFATGPLPKIAKQTAADLRDTEALESAALGCDAIVQLAAMSNDLLGELEPALTRSVNLDATLEVVRIAAGRPLLLYSSASVYGLTAERCGETSTVRPLTLYSELKVAVERAALALPRALVLRNGTVHGPAPILRTDLLLNAMVGSAVTTGEIVLTTTRATARPVLDVRDLAALSVGLLERGSTGLYNAAATNVTVGEAADLVAGLTGAKVVSRYGGADRRSYAMDTTKLERAVASWWRPRPLEESVADLVRHYRAIGLTAADVASRRYHRIAQYNARPAVAAAG